MGIGAIGVWRQERLGICGVIVGIDVGGKIPRRAEDRGLRVSNAAGQCGDFGVTALKTAKHTETEISNVGDPCTERCVAREDIGDVALSHGSLLGSMPRSSG